MSSAFINISFIQKKFNFFVQSVLIFIFVSHNATKTKINYSEGESLGRGITITCELGMIEVHDRTRST